ncbi:MAG TPA: caspase family protein [Vicinamibacterales bacterium]
MKTSFAALTWAIAMTGAAAAASAAVPVQRFVLVVGANLGGGDRAKLLYAISDAERFARVMLDLGGVPQANEVVLRQPKLNELIDALDALNARVVEARRLKEPGRIEIIVYYSGHADEQGLLIGSDRYSYRTLRDRLDQIPADVRIAVLDACASGAFTRLKGGKVRPPFLVDESAAMRGHAFLTSSAETESAQESDRIRGSFFTHYLISGFRGAADLSGDGKITLNEAYQFAFNETLGRTVDTRGGAQHPSYDINLSGSGDVVMTDVRQTTATLVLGEDLEGRFFIRNAAQELVVELYKPYGRKINLGVEPGAYEVRLDRDKQSMLAKTRVEDGGTVTLEPKQFGQVTLEATKKRGDSVPPVKFAVNGRYRIEVTVGGAHGLDASNTPSGVLVYSTNTALIVGGLQFTTFMREGLALTVGADARTGSADSTVSAHSMSASHTSLVAVPIGVRWNPFTSNRPSSAVKPFIGATLGPVFGSTSQSVVASGVVSSSNSTHSTVGGDVLAGADFHIVRWLSFDVNGGYNWMANFDEPGLRGNHNGAKFTVSFGFLWGHGR